MLRHPRPIQMATIDDFDLLHTMIGAGRRLEDVIPAADTGDYLVILEGADPGKVVEIGEEPLTIGRDARQTIVFATDSEVSRLHGRFVLIPISDQTRGHQTHSLAIAWKHHLAELLAATEPK